MRILLGVECVRKVVKAAISRSQTEEFRVRLMATDVRPKWPDESRR